MRNKGFTLIELLAVIVILAIIALIATPIVLGIIEDARGGASERSAEYILKNVELAYSRAFMNSYEEEGGTAAGAVPKIGEVAKEFEMDGASMNPSTGVITADDTAIVCTTSTDDGLSITCTVNEDKKFTTSITMDLAS